MTKYPDGYGKSMVTMAELKRRHAGDMEPEFARRLFNWLESKGGKVGIGGGWRPNPSSVSRASREGRSFHQTQTFFDGSKYYCAVDLVHVNERGGIHRGIQWSEVIRQDSADAKKWGVHCNIQKPQEPWHMQPIEIDGHGSWVRNGRPRPKAGYKVPGKAAKVSAPKAVGGDLGRFSPDNSEYGLFPAKTDKPEVSQASKPRPDDLVRYLQGVMKNQCQLAGIDVDGYFGEKTEAAVKAVQKWNGIKQSGRCDARTWRAIDGYANV